MKCKKPNCNGVVEIGVCTKCGAESGPAPANEDSKEEKDSKGKEPLAASLKGTSDTQSKLAEKVKAASAAKADGKSDGKDKTEPAKEKSSDKHKEHENKAEQKADPGHRAKAEDKAEHKGKAEHKDSEHKKEIQKEATSKDSGRKEEQTAKASSEAASVAKKDEPAEKSKAVTPPPLAGTSEQKLEPKMEPTVESKAEPEAKAGCKVESKAEVEAKPESKVKPESKIEPDQYSTIGPSTSASRESKSDSGTPKPAEQPAKKSSTEERKKIESTIQGSVVPASIEEKLSLKEVDLEDTAAYRNIIRTVRSMLQPHEVAPSRDDLYQASRALRNVIPYNFEAWRLHADLLLTAIRQLETRQLQPDPNFTLMAIPLREDDLRDAAEQALRECAHFADNEKLKIELIDEANSIRRHTWF